MKSLKTFYDTLQVPRNATIAALRTAHKALSEQLQPERHPEDPGAAARQLLLVNKALEVLIHPHARDAYDAWLNARKVDANVPTLPELAEPPSQASASTKVSTEPLAPLPTLDLEGFAAEVAAKANAKTKASAPAPQAGAATAAPVQTRVPTTPPPPPAPAPQAPSTPSGFAETQPYHPADAEDLPDLEAPSRKAAATAASARASSALGDATTPGASPRAVLRRSPALEALDWLRDRPIALIAAVLLCVLLIAFAPWLWRASFGAHKSELPATPPLQPTYVEPPAEAVSAPAAVAVPVEAVDEPTAEQAAVAPPTESKPARKAKPRTVAKRVAEPKRAQAPIAPAPEPEPVAAPVPVDTGGHSGFAPKCRWVTPTNWSCK